MRISDWSSDVCSSDLAHRFIPKLLDARSIFTQSQFRVQLRRMPMQRKLLIAVAATLVLVGCSDSKPAEPTPGKQEVAKVKTMKEIDPEAYHSNIESAMAEIPKIGRASCRERVCQYV